MPYTIAVDFDDTLFLHTNYPEAKGKPNYKLIRLLSSLQLNYGMKIILYTCRENESLESAIRACEACALTFDEVNHSLKEWIDYYGNARKIGAHFYIDDKAIGYRHGKFKF